MGSPVPENPDGASGAPKEGMAPGDGGAEDQGIWPAGAPNDAVRGGCPGARFGGKPVFDCGDSMPTCGISPSMGDCGGAGGQAGGPAGAGAGTGGGDQCCTGAATGAGWGEVTVCPQLGHGPETPAICAGTVRVVRQKPHWNWSISGFISSGHIIMIIFINYHSRIGFDKLKLKK